MLLLGAALAGEAIHVLEGHTDFVRSLAALGADADGASSRVASASDDKTLRIWRERAPPAAHLSPRANVRWQLQ